MSFNSVTGYLSGGLIDPSTPNYAGLAAKNEKMRQAQINQGMNAINAVYDGGSYPYYATAGGTYDPATQYYKVDKKGNYVPFMAKGTPVAGGSGNVRGGQKGNGINAGGGAAIGAGAGGLVAGLPGLVVGGGLGALVGGLFGSSNKPPRPYTLLKNGKLFQQFKSPEYSGFGQSFYDKAASDYVQYAVPQVAQQADEARRSITYGLANRGLLGSSAQQKANTDLNLNIGQQEQQIADNARTTANNLQTQVQNSRQNAINNLYQSADPAGAAASAVSSAAQFSVPQSFTPILNAFSGLANQYATNQLFNNYTPTQYAGSPQQSTSLNLGAALGPTTY